MFSFSQEDNVACNLQVNVLYYSQTSKQKRKRSHVSLAAGVKPPVTGDQREEHLWGVLRVRGRKSPLL